MRYNPHEVLRFLVLARLPYNNFCDFFSSWKLKWACKQQQHQRQSFSFPELGFTASTAQFLLKHCSMNILFPSLPWDPLWEKCAGLIKKHGYFSQEVIQKLFPFPDFYHPTELHICYIKKSRIKFLTLIRIRRFSTIIRDSRKKDLNTTIHSLNIMLQ